MKKIRILVVSLFFTASCAFDNPNEFVLDPTGDRISDLKTTSSKKEAKAKQSADNDKNKEDIVSNQEIQTELEKVKSNETKLRINKKLWISSVEVVSSIFPISTIDSNTGLIVSDWATINDNKHERYKVNVLIKNEELSKDNILITTFKQKYSNQKWINDNTDGIFQQEIQNKILNKAQSLKAE